MAQGVISGRVAAAFGYIAALIAVLIVCTAAFNPQTSTIDLEKYGAVGDGVSINNSIFQTAFTAGANGGKIRVPCGTYKITATPSVTIASGKHLDIEGDGMGCAVIFVSGAIAGPTINFTDQWSSLRVANLTVITDQAGGTNCFVAQGTYTAATSLGSANTFDNVAFRGNDAFTTNTKYCGVGALLSGLSNFELDNLDFTGIASRAGKAISFSGTATANSVGLLITNSTWRSCDTGVNYGDYTQGVQIQANNAAGCTNGISTVSSPSGTLSGLIAAENIFDTFTCGVCINATSFANWQLANNQFVVESNSKAILAQGSNFSINSGNSVRGATTTGTSGVVVGTTSGSSTIAGDYSGLAVAFTVQAASAANFLYIDRPRLKSNTLDYSISTSSSGTVIDDNVPRSGANVNANALCNTSISNSHFFQNDELSTTFQGNSNTGGFLRVRIACDGSNWKND